MKNANVVKTEHLTIYPLSDSEMENLIVVELDADMKLAYLEMLDGCKQNPEQRIWYAIWNMQLNDETGKSVGDLSFKGLDSNGRVEIGYGIKTGFRLNGIMGVEGPRYVFKKVKNY